MNLIKILKIQMEIWDQTTMKTQHISNFWWDVPELAFKGRM